MGGRPTHLLRSVFFFQAEDGIRDYKVTGVQTCALPISLHGMPIVVMLRSKRASLTPGNRKSNTLHRPAMSARRLIDCRKVQPLPSSSGRSEERRGRERV